MVDLSQIENQHWEEAQRRASVLRPLAEHKNCPRDKALEAANELGLSKRQIYRLIKQLREADGELTALIKRGSNGGRDKHRLDASRENIINRLITEFFLTRQKKSKASLVREIRKVSLSSGLKPASESTIRRRLKKLSPAQLKQRGERHPEAKPIYGETPASDTPLDWIQMDHTPVDLTIVDPIDRLPIGRPWITIAIDVFSRCIAGFFLSLEAPSATSVGLCLTMVVSDKKTWLEQRGIDTSWPIVGKPGRIGVDNASEFHSAAFERGCKQHGIEIEWRPPGQPHFGGIVERIIGTLMTLIHELPGTTFSNPNQRGDYDSDKTSCLTLEELERWLALAITKYYHLKPHVGMDKDIPLYRYEQGLQAMAHIGKTIPMPRDPRAFLIDFLPAIRRSLQRDGIVIDHITYYSDALRPWIRLQKESGSLLIRRDPRDLSQIYVFDAEDNDYFTVPYRMLSRPPITLWEHKMARKRLREQRREKIDENSLFAAIDEMREIERNAETMTRTARRNRTRRQAVLTSGNPAKQNQPPGSQDYTEPISPYEDIELW